MTDRWPFCFSLDEIQVKGVLESDGGWEIVDSDRVPGVYVQYRDGDGVMMTIRPTREENFQLALQRLDRLLRKRATGL